MMSTAMVVDQSQIGDLRSLFEPRIKELNAIATEIAKSETKDEYGYLVTGISKLTSMMLDCEQYLIDIDPDGDAILVDRVVKVNRYINNNYLRLHGIDNVVVAGLYIAVPMYLLPANKVKKATRNRWKSIMNPEEFGLPSTELADYGTFKPMSASAYTVMAKFPGNYANEIINMARHYDHIFLN